MLNPKLIGLVTVLAATVAGMGWAGAAMAAPIEVGGTSPANGTHWNVITPGDSYNYQWHNGSNLTFGSNGANVYLDGGASLDFAPTADVSLSVASGNAGTLHIGGAGGNGTFIFNSTRKLTLYNDRGSIAVDNGGLLRFLQAGTIDLGAGRQVTVNTGGTLTVDAAGNTAFTSSGYASGMLLKGGTVNVNQGTLKLYGLGTGYVTQAYGDQSSTGGTVNVGAGAKLQLLNNAAGGANGGGPVWNGTFTGTVNPTGLVEIQDLGSPAYDSTATLNFTDGNRNNTTGGGAIADQLVLSGLNGSTVRLVNQGKLILTGTGSLSTPNQYSAAGLQRYYKNASNQNTQGSGDGVLQNTGLILFTSTGTKSFTGDGMRIVNRLGGEFAFVAAGTLSASDWSTFAVMANSKLSADVGSGNTATLKMTNAASKRGFVIDGSGSTATIQVTSGTLAIWTSKAYWSGSDIGEIADYTAGNTVSNGTLKGGSYLINGTLAWTTDGTTNYTFNTIDTNAIVKLQSSAAAWAGINGVDTVKGQFWITGGKNFTTTGNITATAASTNQVVVGLVGDTSSVLKLGASGTNTLTTAGTVSGFGTINGGVTVNSGGTLRPGDATNIGTLKTGNFNPLTGAKLPIKLTSAANDLVNVNQGSGNITLSGAAVVYPKIMAGNTSVVSPATIAQWSGAPTGDLAWTVDTTGPAS